MTATVRSVGLTEKSAENLLTMAKIGAKVGMIDAETGRSTVVGNTSGAEIGILGRLGLQQEMNYVCRFQPDGAANFNSCDAEYEALS